MTAPAQRIVDLGASLFARRITFGRTGNISVLDGDRILLTPTGVSLGALDADGLSALSADGSHLSGPAPTKEAFLHLAMYRARPSASAVVHVHSTHSVAVSCMAGLDPGDVLPPLTAYYAMRVGSLPLIPYHAPGDASLGALAQEMAREHHALLLANHGPIVAGGDLAAAADAVEEIEETARIFLLLRSTATTPLTPEQVDALRS